MDYACIDKSSPYFNDPLMYEVVGACFTVHKELKWALYERAYQLALVHLLTKLGHKAVTEAPIDFFFQGDRISSGLRADILVDDRLIIETKCVDELTSEHHFQIHTYMLLSKLPLGLLVNFHAHNLRDKGIYRKSLESIQKFYNLYNDRPNVLIFNN